MAWRLRVLQVPGERDQKVPLRLLTEGARAGPPPPPAHPTGLKIRIARPCVSMRREAPRACSFRPTGFKIRIARPVADAHMPRVPSPPRAFASAPSLTPAAAGGAARTTRGMAHVADPPVELEVAGPGHPGRTTAAVAAAEGAAAAAAGRSGACTFLPVEYIHVGKLTV